MVMVNPEDAPFSAAETMGVKTYQIMDASGAVIAEDSSPIMYEIAEGKMGMEIPINELPSGSYKLVITAFITNAKAEQPLTISGYWECEFEL